MLYEGTHDKIQHKLSKRQGGISIIFFLFRIEPLLRCKIIVKVPFQVYLRYFCITNCSSGRILIKPRYEGWCGGKSDMHKKWIKKVI